jgi:hypothetical protein
MNREATGYGGFFPCSPRLDGLDRHPDQPSKNRLTHLKVLAKAFDIGRMELGGVLQAMG